MLTSAAKQLDAPSSAIVEITPRVACLMKMASSGPRGNQWSVLHVPLSSTKPSGYVLLRCTVTESRMLPVNRQTIERFSKKGSRFEENIQRVLLSIW